jgi:hypothetical protein
VNDVGASLTRYRALLGEFDVQRAPLSGYGITLAILPLGTTTLTLVSPTRTPHEPAAGLASDVRKHLATRGEGVFAVALETQADDAARELARELTHGATLELVARS